MLVKASRRAAGYLALALTCIFNACLPVAIAGASQGIDYTFTQVAYRSFTRTQAQAHAACLQAMSNMQIVKLSDDKSDGSIRIEGKTKDLKVIIWINKITPKLTKVSVNAKKNFFVKDKTVAVEVLMQMAQILGVR